MVFRRNARLLSEPLVVANLLLIYQWRAISGLIKLPGPKAQVCAPLGQLGATPPKLLLLLPGLVPLPVLIVMVLLAAETALTWNKAARL